MTPFANFGSVRTINTRFKRVCPKVEAKDIYLHKITINIPWFLSIYLMLDCQLVRGRGRHSGEFSPLSDRNFCYSFHNRQALLLFFRLTEIVSRRFYYIFYIIILVFWIGWLAMRFFAWWLIKWGITTTRVISFNGKCRKVPHVCRFSLIPIVHRSHKQLSCPGNNKEINYTRYKLMGLLHRYFFSIIDVMLTLCPKMYRCSSKENSICHGCPMLRWWGWHEQGSLR